MASADERVYFRSKNGLKDRVERYRDEHGYDNLSDAARELVEIGLRESRSPFMARVKDWAIELSYNMATGGLIVLVLALTTDILTPMHGVQVATLFWVTAMLILSGLSFSRTVVGANDIGAALGIGDAE